jgi:hypothetical protein
MPKARPQAHDPLQLPTLPAKKIEASQDKMSRVDNQSGIERPLFWMLFRRVRVPAVLIELEQFQPQVLAFRVFFACVADREE